MEVSFFLAAAVSPLLGLPKRGCVMCHRVTEGHLPVCTKQFNLWDLSHKEKMRVIVVV